MKKYLKIEKKKAVLYGVIAFLVVLAGYRVASNSGSGEAVQVTQKVSLVSAADMINSQSKVEVVGEVEALEQVELRSQVTGQVQFIGANIGDQVRKGQILLSLSNADLYAQLQQAYAQIEDAKIGVQQTEASLQQSQLRFQELSAGARTEELDISQTQVDNAQRQLAVTQEKAQEDLQNLYDDIPTFLNDIYISADDALNRQIGGIFGNTQEFSSDLPRLVFDSFNAQAKIDAEWGRHLARTKMRQMKQEIDALPNDNTQRYLYLEQARVYVSSFLPFLEASVEATDGAIALSEAERNGYKGQINSARTSLNALVQRVEDYRQRVDSQQITNENAITAAQNAVLLAQKQSNLTQAGTRSETLSTQESLVKQSELGVAAGQARVRQAQASAALIQAQLAKTIIRSPIDGTVSAMPLRVGDLATGGALVSGVVNTQGYQLKAYISASDVSLATVGSKVYLNDDSKVELGEVTRVSPSIDPVKRKVEIVIALSGQREYVIGEFLDVVIESNNEQIAQVYLVPLEAVKTSTQGASVYVLDSEGKTQAVDVVLGRVVGENVEVLAGLEQSMNILSSARGIKIGQEVEVQ